MDGGVALAYNAPMRCVYHPAHRPFNAHAHTGSGNGQPAHILHSILSMNVERQDLVSQSPPGHGYIITPPAGNQCPSRGLQYPTPPSSHSSTPEPAPCLPPARRSPAAAAAARAPEQLNRDWSDSYSNGSVSPSPPGGIEYDPAGAGDFRAYRERPMDLKKRPYSPETGEEGGNELEPMDLRCPKKLKTSCDSYVPSPHHNHHYHPSAAQRCSPNSPLNSPPPPPSPSRTRIAEQEKCARQSWTNSRLVYQLPAAPLNDSILKSILCGRLRSRSPSPTQNKDAKDDSRTGSPFLYSLSNCHGLTRSPQERISELIRRAKTRQQQHNFIPTSPDMSMTSSSAAPSSDVTNVKPSSRPMPPLIKIIPTAMTMTAPHMPTIQKPEVVVAGGKLPHNTEVSLAKKNLLPVSAHISDWLVKLVQFAKSVPEFSSLAQNDRLSLVLASWSRLLLLDMAETNFQFAVNPASPASSPPRRESSTEGDRVTSRPMTLRPTVDSVERIMSFLRKCQGLEISAEEMTYLRLLTLFNPSYQSVECPAYIENVNAYVRRCLRDCCESSAPGRGTLRYSHLLLVLPPLFGVRPEVMETLFCQHIIANTDMQVLLKEMLHKL